MRSTGGPPPDVGADDVPQRVHAGVGPTGDGEVLHDGEERLERVRDHALDRAQPGCAAQPWNPVPSYSSVSFSLTLEDSRVRSGTRGRGGARFGRLFFSTGPATRTTGARGTWSTNSR